MRDWWEETEDSVESTASELLTCCVSLGQPTDCLWNSHFFPMWLCRVKWAWHQRGGLSLTLLFIIWNTLRKSFISFTIYKTRKTLPASFDLSGSFCDKKHLNTWRLEGTLSLVCVHGKSIPQFILCVGGCPGNASCGAAQNGKECL